MRRVVLFLSVLAALAVGQWVLKDIRLPDSLGGIQGSFALVCCPSEGKAYVSGESGIAVVDLRSRARVGRMLSGQRVFDLAFRPSRHKLYAAVALLAGVGVPGVAVIDTRTDSVVARVACGQFPYRLAVSSSPERIYCADAAGNTVFGIDADADTVRSRILVGTYPRALAVCEAERKLYCGNRRSDDVTVVDMDGDSVLKTLGVPSRAPIDLQTVAGKGKVYCAGFNSPVLAVIDCRTDTILDTVWSGYRPLSLCLDSTRAKVYCANGGSGTLAVFDAEGDTLVKLIEVGETPSAVAWSSSREKVYCALEGEDAFAVVCGRGDTVLARAPAGHLPRAVEVADSLALAVGATRQGGVSLISLDGDSTVAVIRVTARPSAMAVIPGVPKLYAVSGDNFGSVDVVNTELGVAVREVRVGSQPTDILCVSLRGRAYVVNSGLRDRSDSTLTVLDCTGDSVVASVVVGEHPIGLCEDTHDEELYVPTLVPPALAVVDVWTDSVVARIGLPPEPTSLCYNAAARKTYVAHMSNRMSVVDARAESLIGSVTTSCPPSLHCNPHVNKVYVLPSVEQHPVLVIDGASNSVIAQLQLPSFPVAACHGRDGRWTYLVHGWDGRLTAVDAVVDTVGATVPVGEGPEDALYLLSNRRVYCANAYSGSVSVVDVPSMQSTATLPVGRWPVRLAEGPDGRCVYAANQSGSSITSLRDTLSPAVEDGRHRIPASRGRGLEPTLVRGRSLVLHESSLLVDACGRVLAETGQASMFVAVSSPGVYFIRLDGPGHHEVRKVVVTR